MDKEYIYVFEKTDDEGRHITYTDEEVKKAGLNNLVELYGVVIELKRKGGI